LFSDVYNPELGFSLQSQKVILRCNKLFRWTITKSNSNPPLIPPPILNLGERNTKNCSNQTLIWFLTLGELSSGARDLLHLGALLRTLIRARRATTGLPAPPGTSPRLPSAPPQSQRPCLAARSETKAWRERGPVDVRRRRSVHPTRR